MRGFVSATLFHRLFFFFGGGSSDRRPARLDVRANFDANYVKGRGSMKGCLFLDAIKSEIYTSFPRKS